LEGVGAAGQGVKAGGAAAADLEKKAAKHLPEAVAPFTAASDLLKLAIVPVLITLWGLSMLVVIRVATTIVKAGRRLRLAGS
jgi:hypothetical protein